MLAPCLELQLWRAEELPSNRGRVVCFENPFETKGHPWYNQHPVVDLDDLVSPFLSVCCDYLSLSNSFRSARILTLKRSDWADRHWSLTVDRIIGRWPAFYPPPASGSSVSHAKYAPSATYVLCDIPDIIFAGVSNSWDMLKVFDNPTWSTRDSTGTRSPREVCDSIITCYHLLKHEYLAGITSHRKFRSLDTCCSGPHHFLNDTNSI